jgi:hypothetical protein
MMTEIKLNEGQIVRLLHRIGYDKICEYIDANAKIWANSNSNDIHINWSLTLDSDNNYYKEFNEEIGRVYCDTCKCWIFNYEKHIMRKKHKINILQQPNNENEMEDV